MKPHLMVAFSAFFFFTASILFAQEAQRLNSSDKQKVLMEQKTLIDKSLKRHKEELFSLNTRLKAEKDYWVKMTLFDTQARAQGSRDRSWDIKGENVNNNIRSMEYKIKDLESGIEQLEIKKGS